MDWKLLFFAVVIFSSILFISRIVVCIDYFCCPAPHEVAEVTLQEIRIVAAAAEEAPPRIPDKPPHYGGLVYDVCSSSSSSRGEEEDDGDGGCIICLEEYSEGERRATVAACNHRFHASCMEAWLATDEKHSCPICRCGVD